MTVFLLANYIRKADAVTAVRFTESNMKELAELIDGELLPECSQKAARVEFEGKFAYVGDWLVLRDPESIEFWDDEDFLSKYHSNAEALSESDRLAKVHEIVQGAMSAAKFGQPGSDGWEAVALLAAKHVLSTT